jgi:adenylate cyclase
MAREGANRKLAAILSADAVGYSRLMAADEEATVAAITAHRRLISQHVTEHRGRVVDSPGDNLLAEFASAVDAVSCAMKIQKELEAINSAVPETRRMLFRMGINLGDVIEEDGRLYGDGVNVAARLEGLAAPGGVSISRSIFDQVKNKLELGFESQGQHRVKNISEPVMVYRVLPDKAAVKRPRWRKAVISIAAALLLIATGALALWHYQLRPAEQKEAAPSKTASTLPIKPSIAVLPFANLSSEAKDDYLADGISDNIITALSKIDRIAVIARNSSFIYKGKSIKVQQVAKELGVRYVLEGSVLKSGDKLRVNAQLIDAKSGHHLWAQNYDRPFKDLFNVMDEITMNIVLALEVKLARGEQVRLWHKTTSLQAWGELTKGMGPLLEYNKEGMAISRRYFKRAVELDPNYAFAWTMLASTYVAEARFGFSKNPRESLRRGMELALKSERLDPDQPLNHGILGVIYLVQRKYDLALAEGEKAMALGPNDTPSMALHALTLSFVGQPQQAAILCQKAIRLHPRCPYYFYTILGIALCDSGQLKEAEEVFRNKLLKQKMSPYQTIRGRSWLVIVLMEQGREQDAYKEVKQILAKYPEATVRQVARGMLYKDPAMTKRRAAQLRKAGLPE